MKWNIFWKALLAIVIPLVMATGCSGGNQGDNAGTSINSASGQVAANIFVQQWGQILWGLVTSQTGTEIPSYGDPIFNEDGSVSQSVTTADGTIMVITMLSDGSVHLDITWPNGSTQTMIQSVPDFDGVSKTIIGWHITSSEGLVVDYTSVVDDQGTIFDMSDDTTELQGTSSLPGGLTQDFTVQTAAGQTTVASSQSDGSTFAMTVPLSSPDFMYPDFSQPATGSYSNQDVTISLTLSATENAPFRWAEMTTVFDGGLTGGFAVHPDFSGSGQIEEDGELQAMLTWTRTGETEVRYPTAEQSSTLPAGAAVDYLINRWQTLTALLAPAPGMGSVRLPSSNYYRNGFSINR